MAHWSHAEIVTRWTQLFGVPPLISVGEMAALAQLNGATARVSVVSIDELGTRKLRILSPLDATEVER